MHHPPITNFLILNPNYKMHGHLELVGKFKKNSLVGGFKGKINIEFADGQFVTFSYPRFRAGGMIMGSRTVDWEETMTFEDKENGLTCNLAFGAVRKKSMFRKAIGKIDDFKGEITQNGTKLCDIEGNWLHNLVIDGEEYWNIDEVQPAFHNFDINPLPSDWRYREDLVWLAKGNPEIAQKWKIKVENRQRDDRKLRGLKH